MLSLFALLLSAPLAAPAPDLADQLNVGIWNDLQLNAMIGNGNWLASLWYNAGRDDGEPDLHIRDLRCRPYRDGYRCAFRLLRDGGVREVYGQEAPDRLACTAIFVRDAEQGGFAVGHLRPGPRGGHSRTQMRCRRLRSTE